MTHIIRVNVTPQLKNHKRCSIKCQFFKTVDEEYKFKEDGKTHVKNIAVCTLFENPYTRLKRTNDGNYEVTTRCFAGMNGIEQ